MKKQKPKNYIMVKVGMKKYISGSAVFISVSGSTFEAAELVLERCFWEALLLSSSPL